mmetsp:Transcript_53/g.103  ORF Transcript_53/g.103 Transcript_53/m.103 type:complete len:134 (-) Transcript_53:267-668(-)|eukprot:CAMPEP_0197493858 /NCGR_PEP_ID=MMETSP1311-20131121/25184_1 /TAXON_ID=464262 /ORGANISM="Genus nov. species nov., Strain RCC856" /LENGTH=133 /DNA_ID=CAMNT_0043039163 /DNA_START=209 /DNA_END=610 /DNA_ORIENTATION=-
MKAGVLFALVALAAIAGAHAQVESILQFGGRPLGLNSYSAVSTGLTRGPTDFAWADSGSIADSVSGARETPIGRFGRTISLGDSGSAAMANTWGDFSGDAGAATADFAESDVAAPGIDTWANFPELGWIVLRP